GIGLVGVLVIVQLLVNTLLDYPTGALGDHIGQRYVIASALLCYSVAFLLTATLTVDSPFYVFLVIYILMGIGSSQESGAFDAWFDNNYRAAMPHDKDRKQYGVFRGRLGMLWQVASTLVLIPGSFLALVFGRRWVFQLQAVLCVILALAVLRLIRDLPQVEQHREQESKEKGRYRDILRDGVRFLGADRFVTLTVLGEVVIWATGTLWWTIILFPLYFSYLISDVAVSSFRTLVFVPEAVVRERSGTWSKRFDPVTWIPRFRLIQFLGFFFYILLAVVTLVFPVPLDRTQMLQFYVPNTDILVVEFPVQGILPMALIFVVFVVTEMFSGFAEILTQRVMIDVIPNRIRNSMYSLKPTLATILSIPLIGVFGWVLQLFGFPPTFLLVSIIALMGALLIREGFKHPVPKIEGIVEAKLEEKRELEELEVT
ncbi:MFS transporter, partial [Candidatus Thorarchaeota archaeon]